MKTKCVENEKRVEGKGKIEKLVSVQLVLAELTLKKVVPVILFVFFVSKLIILTIF